MTISTMWMQNVAYPARLDRLVIQRLYGDRELVTSGLVVSQNGAGDVSVNISAGAATIIGDDQSFQGMYQVENDAVFNLAMPAVPGSDKRYDLISLRVNDPQAGGPVGDNSTFVVTQGSVSATPSIPAGPTSSIPIYAVLRTAGDGAILTAQLTDQASRGIWPYTVSTAAPPAKLPPNYLYIKVA